MSLIESVAVCKLKGRWDLFPEQCKDSKRANSLVDAKHMTNRDVPLYIQISGAN